MEEQWKSISVERR